MFCLSFDKIELMRDRWWKRPKATSASPCNSSLLAVLVPMPLKKLL